MNSPKDPTSLVGLLQCKDGTAAVYGKRHNMAESEMGLHPSEMLTYGTVRLTREAGEVLKELLGEWLAAPNPSEAEK